jgi:hypothetical protein
VLGGGRDGGARRGAVVEHAEQHAQVEGGLELVETGLDVPGRGVGG